ncbi:MAG: hypothetical protein WC249_01570 [Patescibacteria group bacterium]|jgi:hypothetical protein
MKNILFILPVVLLLAAGCSLTSNVDLNSSNNQPNTPTNSPSVTTDTVSQKFVDQPYYSYSYLISGDTLSTDAQQALAGFALTKKALPDGTTQIDLKAQKAEYKDQQYILKSGEQLYFVEKFLADDQNNQENNILDDQAAVVDSQGNVVTAPISWK